MGHEVSTTCVSRWVSRHDAEAGLPNQSAYADGTDSMLFQIPNKKSQMSNSSSLTHVSLPHRPPAC